MAAWLLPPGTVGRVSGLRNRDGDKDVLPAPCASSLELSAAIDARDFVASFSVLSEPEPAITPAIEHLFSLWVSSSEDPLEAKTEWDLRVPDRPTCASSVSGVWKDVLTEGADGKHIAETLSPMQTPSSWWELSARDGCGTVAGFSVTCTSDCRPRLIEVLVLPQGYDCPGGMKSWQRVGSVEVLAGDGPWRVRFPSCWTSVPLASVRLVFQPQPGATSIVIDRLSLQDCEDAPSPCPTMDLEGATARIPCFDVFRVPVSGALLVHSPRDGIVLPLRHADDSPVQVLHNEWKTLRFRLDGCARIQSISDPQLGLHWQLHKEPSSQPSRMQDWLFEAGQEACARCCRRMGSVGSFFGGIRQGSTAFSAVGTSPREDDYPLPMERLTRPLAATRPFMSFWSLLFWRPHPLRDALIRRSSTIRPDWARCSSSRRSDGACRLVCHDCGVSVHRQDAYCEVPVTERAVCAGAADRGREYRFSRWQCCDMFVFFSHARVSVPPARWIDNCHENDCLCLGTIVAEWDHGAQDTALLLDPSTRSQLAQRLAEVAWWHGFDGYLLNFECPCSLDTVGALRQFCVELRKCMAATVGPYSRVVWYDSVSAIHGGLAWQSKVSEHNLEWLGCCDLLFLDYHWTEEHLVESCDALPSPLERRRVLFGVDVFGRGSFGGGKTQTVVAVQAALSAGFSVALFAPGWTYESTGDIHDWEDLEAVFWGDGESLRTEELPLSSWWNCRPPPPEMAEAGSFPDREPPEMLRWDHFGEVSRGESLCREGVAWEEAEAEKGCFALFTAATGEVKFSHRWGCIETVVASEGATVVSAMVCGAGPDPNDPVWMGVAAYYEDRLLWQGHTCLTAVGASCRSIRVEMPSGLPESSRLWVRIAGRDAERWAGHFGAVVSSCGVSRHTTTGASLSRTLQLSPRSLPLRVRWDTPGPVQPPWGLGPGVRVRRDRGALVVDAKDAPSPSALVVLASAMHHDGCHPWTIALGGDFDPSLLRVCIVAASDLHAKLEATQVGAARWRTPTMDSHSVWHVCVGLRASGSCSLSDCGVWTTAPHPAIPFRAVMKLGPPATERRAFSATGLEQEWIVATSGGEDVCRDGVVLKSLLAGQSSTVVVDSSLDRIELVQSEC
jgi:hypothetical protein